MASLGIASRTRRSRADLLASPQYLSQVCEHYLVFQNLTSTEILMSILMHVVKDQEYINHN